MRPSWTLLRDGELHTMTLVTGNVDTEIGEAAFSIHVTPVPSVLEDEVGSNSVHI